ncbi:MAG: hypothetical protein IRY85_19820 [Micromonosporaceae bacterium]|nr:hypothetical protein [Micromonosporaceae bacterium]
MERASWHVMTGTPYAIRLGTGLRRQRVPVRGRQFAGVVEAVGRNVSTIQPGDEVYGTTGSGAWAQFAVTRPSTLARRPATVSFDQAAVAPISGGTALQAVRDAARVRPGQRVMVIGAAGGVGSFAVQIAVALRARVTGVCAPERRLHVCLTRRSFVTRLSSLRCVACAPFLAGAAFPERGIGADGRA